MLKHKDAKIAALEASLGERSRFAAKQTELLQASLNQVEETREERIVLEARLAEVERHRDAHHASARRRGEELEAHRAYVHIW